MVKTKEIVLIKKILDILGAKTISSMSNKNNLNWVSVNTKVEILEFLGHIEKIKFRERNYYYLVEKKKEFFKVFDEILNNLSIDEKIYLGYLIKKSIDKTEGKNDNIKREKKISRFN